MPRPRKCRRVCRMPEINEFAPTDSVHDGQVVVMTIDEYETIRLIDREGFSQEECGESMGIARSTVQQIYNNARKKLADAIVSGMALRIEGGDYIVCDASKSNCRCGGCLKRAGICK